MLNCSGVTTITTWAIYIISGVVAVAGFLYQFTPVLFSHSLLWIVRTSLTCFPDLPLVRILSFLLFGNFLSFMVEAHKEMPQICVALCRYRNHIKYDLLAMQIIFFFFCGI